jgi:hypothetical protein|tara:strand:- start:60 stop:359 length:300 start_codon:yes stop_codon:yes gene_type:complete
MSMNNNDATNDPLVNPLIVDCQGDLVEPSQTPEVHPEFLAGMEPLIAGDLVSTADGKIGLVMSPSILNHQNVLFFLVMVDGEQLHYNRLQLKKIDGDKA